MNIFSDAIEQLGIFTIVGGILAIVATVLAYVFIVPEKRREKLNAFGKFLHDTCNFKYLIVEIPDRRENSAGSVHFLHGRYDHSGLLHALCRA